MKNYTPEEVIEKIKSITNDQQDTELAQRLGIQKQSLYQYKKKTSVDVQLRIITLLIDLLEKKV